MVFFDPTVIVGDTCVTIAGADPYLFGLLQSATFTAWQDTVGGRIKSDPRFSIENVYNTFPFPDPTDAQRLRVAEAGEGVLAARARHKDASLDDLYDPLATPLDLIRAHRVLDKAVDGAFGRRFRNDTERLVMLFERYEETIQRLTLAPANSRRRPRTRRRS